MALRVGYPPIIPGLLGGYNWDPVGERIMITFISESDIYRGMKHQ
jgi:hypothetical protein